MPTRTADARWEGSLTDGHGTMRMASGAYEGPYSFQSRFQEGDGTNPEELIGAAHAGCYSMALSGELNAAGYTPDSVNTNARVRIDKVGEGFKITRIDLSTRVRVAGMSEAEFHERAESAKLNCPVSQALAGVDISLEAELVS